MKMVKFRGMTLSQMSKAVGRGAKQTAKSASKFKAATRAHLRASKAKPI
jgi:hypothetical protein